MSIDAGLTLSHIGAFSDSVPLSVTDSSSISHTISSGKRFIQFQNVGSASVWYGGSTVDPSTSRGNILLPHQTLCYREATSSFQVFFKCASGDSSTIGVVEG